MPTYDYECPACEHTFERFQSITATPLRRCPQCGSRRLRRLIGAGAGILFRGSGFYQTDYRSEEYKAKAKAEKTSGTSSETSSETPSGTSSGASNGKAPGGKGSAKKPTARNGGKADD